MKVFKILFFCCLFLGMGGTGLAQANLMTGWDGNGDTNQATSYPDRYGWRVSPGVFNYANASSGIRYADVTTGHTLNNSNYTGRLLMVRWDATASTTLNTVYSYPVELEANKRYSFSWLYEWWNNATAPTYTVGVSSNRTGSPLIASKEFVTAGKNVLLTGDMSFQSAAAGTYYITIKSSTAALGGIGQLRLVEVPPVLGSSITSVQLSYYTSDVNLSVFPNGSASNISITAPEGIRISAVTLPAAGGSIAVSSLDSSSVAGNIRITQGSDVLEIPVKASFPEKFLQLRKIETLTADGAWCWFNDPRAIYHKGRKEQTYFSWVNSIGDIWISAYNHETGEYKEHLIYPKLEVDDHDNPAIFIRKDGRIIIYFSKHTTAPAHRFISTNPEDITSWGEDYRFGEDVTYPYPFQVEDKIYVFYRGLNWHPTVVISNDNGETVGAPQQFITGGGARPYTRMSQDPTGAIHIAVTTGHPRNEPNNRIYYACFKNGGFYRANGTLIKQYTGSSTALNITEAELVYNATNGKGWIWDITVDAENKPVMVFASFPSDTDHRYHYARWSGTSWHQTQVTKGGKWFPQTPGGRTEPEPNYSGGITLDYNNPSVVYLSKEVKGVFEIFKFTTPDKGITWDSTALTWNTPSHLVNVRPVVPRHHKEGYFDVVWMRGTYVQYTNYNTSLVYQVGEAANRLDRIEITSGVSQIIQGMSQQVAVSFYPFITSNKQLTWSSSDENIVRVANGIITAVGVGATTITATAYNGVTAESRITVVSPAYAANTYFDFGTADSPVTEGGVKVSESTMIANSFGWQMGVLSRDRGAAATNELRDFNLASAASDFIVFVQPGTYHITAKQGDASFAHDNMNIYVNDELKASGVTTAAGSYITSEFDVTTTGNMLKFTFTDEGGSDVNWVINSLNISRNVTSIDKNLESGSKSYIYPNPGSREQGLYIAANGNSSETVVLYIYGISGKVQKQVTLNTSQESRVDISDLVPGLYVAKMVTGKGTHNQILIIR